MSMSTVGVDGARVSLWRFSFLALWVVVVDISQLPAQQQKKKFQNPENTGYLQK